MAGIIWLVRTTESYDVYDGLYYAEPLFHIIENRFGIMDDIFLGWWPIVDPDTGNFIIGKDDAISGKSGVQPVMQLNWHEPGEMRFVKLHVTHPWYDLVETPVPVFTITAAEQRVRVAGPDEMLNNGGANSIEDFTPPFEIVPPVTLTAASSTSDIPQRSGNGFLWIDQPDERFNVQLVNVGSVDNAPAIKNKGNNKQTWHVKGKAVVGLLTSAADNVSNNSLRGLGYRSWAFTKGLNSRKLTFSMVADYTIKGLNFSTRIGYPGNWQLFTTHIENEGQYQAVFHFDPSKVNPENRDKPLCIDWFYDCYYDYSGYTMGVEQKLAFSCMTVHEGHWPAEHLNVSFTSLQQERDNGKRYGLPEMVEYVYGPRASVMYETPLMTDDYQLRLTTSKVVTVTSKSRYGFSFTSNAEADEEWQFSYSAKVVGDLADIL